MICSSECGVISGLTYIKDGFGGCTTCGNSVLDPGEGCDDGNIHSGDGCSMLCVIEPNWGCIDVGGPC